MTKPPPKQESKKNPRNNHRWLQVFLLCSIFGMLLGIVWTQHAIISYISQTNTLLSHFQRIDTVKGDPCIYVNGKCYLQHADAQAACMPLDGSPTVCDRSVPACAPNCARIDTVKDEEKYPVEVHVNCQSKEGDQYHLMAASLAGVDHAWPVKIHGNCLVHDLSMSGQLINKELSDCQKRQENGESVGCAGISHYQKTDPQSDPNLCSKWKTDCKDSMPGSCAVTCDIPKGDE